MIMNDEKKMMNLLERSSDTAAALKIAIELAMAFIVPPGSRNGGEAGPDSPVSEP